MRFEWNFLKNKTLAMTSKMQLAPSSLASSLFQSYQGIRRILRSVDEVWTDCYFPFLNLLSIKLSFQESHGWYGVIFSPSLYVKPKRLFYYFFWGFFGGYKLSAFFLSAVYSSSLIKPSSNNCLYSFNWSFVELVSGGD